MVDASFGAAPELEAVVLDIVAEILYGGRVTVSLDEDLTATGALTSLNRIRILSAVSAVIPAGGVPVEYLSFSFRTARDLVPLLARNRSAGDGVA